MINRLVFTCGDINGIGPEISVKTINKIYKPSSNKIIFFCPSNIFLDTIHKIAPEFPFEISKKVDISKLNTKYVNVIDLGKYSQKFGAPTAASGKASFLSIKKSFDLISLGYSDAMITSPISKTAFNKAGIKFPGHTEMLAEWANKKHFAMMFISPVLKAGLITIHEPIRDVAKLITKKRLKDKLKLIISTLENDFGISSPKIAVLGLNPHAGEEGNIGREEINVIKPVLMELNQGIQGPFVPDAFFANNFHKDFDAVVGMYHDQILIPFKMLGFHSGVNFTAGLPIIRTSPDHGTAYEIAGNYTADPGSMIKAVEIAEEIIQNRKHRSK